MSIPYKCDKCPTCDGTGWVSKSPYSVGDVRRWDGTVIDGRYTCQTCSGQRFLWSEEPRLRKLVEVGV